MKTTRTPVTHPTAGMAVVYIFLSLISGVSLLPSLYGHAPEAEAGEAGSSVIMRCKGSNLTLNDADLGVTVLHVFVSRGGESLASSSVPATGQFQGRLIVEDDGRVTLNSLTPDDLGKYRVEIQQPEDRHIQRTLRLVISEPPETSDGILAVNNLLLPGNSSLRLTCGNFTSLGFPRVSVLWKDPRGNILPSDGFKDQVFYLDLPLNSAVSGEYCCRLDCPSPDSCCPDQLSSQCAPVNVQTDMVEEVRKVDCPSLDSFSHLQQQVLDLAAALRVLQESDRQDCSQSGVSTIAHLVQRQIKCDQLDAYMTRVEDLEDKLMKDLSDVRNDSAETGLQLETRLMESLEEFRLQVTDDVSRLADFVDRLETSANNSREALQTRLEEIVRAADDYQLRASKQIADLEKETKKKINELRTTMGDKFLTIDRNFSLQLSDLATIMAENLTDYYQALASRDLKTVAQISALEQNVSAIEDALISHVTNGTRSIADAQSDVIALFKMTKSLKDSLCSFKTGHPLTSGRCMNVSGVEADYQTAKANCLADGAHLLNLKSRDVDAAVLRNVLTAAGITLPSFYNPLSYWVGANDILTEGSFAWDDGTPLPASSELWNQREPNNANNNEDCVEMFISAQILSLNDNDCGARRQYICEYDL